MVSPVPIVRIVGTAFFGRKALVAANVARKAHKVGEKTLRNQKVIHAVANTFAAGGFAYPKPAIKVTENFLQRQSDKARVAIHRYYGEVVNSVGPEVVPELKISGELPINTLMAAASPGGHIFVNEKLLPLFRIKALTTSALAHELEHARQFGIVFSSLVKERAGDIGEAIRVLNNLFPKGNGKIEIDPDELHSKAREIARTIEVDPQKAERYIRAVKRYSTKTDEFLLKFFNRAEGLLDLPNNLVKKLVIFTRFGIRYNKKMYKNNILEVEAREAAARYVKENFWLRMIPKPAWATSRT